MVAATASMADKLKKWNYLTKRKAKLEESIAKLEKSLAALTDSMSAPGLLSSITQKYDSMLLGLPRASVVKDRMAEQVADTLDKIEETKIRLQSMRAEYVFVSAQLEEIESAVACLSPRYQRLLTMFYRDRLDWRDICDELFISKSRMYQMRDEAIRVLDEGFWGTYA